MRIILPNQFSAVALFPLISNTLGRLETHPEVVEFDFGKLRFVRPSGIVFLSNLSRYLARNGTQVFYIGLREGTEAIKFLDDSLFFEQHLGRKLDEESRPRTTTIPLRNVMTSEAMTWIGLTLIPWLSEKSGIEVEEFAEFRTCIGELFNNISDHTDTGVGSVFCQWYPNESRLMLALADIGVGIPEKVRSVEPDLADLPALFRAFEDGFSSKSIPTNRGAGLHFLKQNVVENLGGTLTVRSRSSAICFKKDGETAVSVPYDNTGYCPGTMFELEIRTDLFDLYQRYSGDISWT